MLNVNNTVGLQGDANKDLKNSLNDLENITNLDGKLCKYFEIEQFQSTFRSNTSNFSMLSLNVRSLTGKFPEFQELIEDLNHEDFKFSIISIQETWNIPVHLNTDIPGYKPLLYKTRTSNERVKNNIGGGVGCWVRDIYEYETLEKLSFFEDKFFESLFLKVITGKSKFKIIGNIYRPPGANIYLFIEKLDEILNCINSDPLLKKAEEVILMGDFNINLLDHETHDGTSKYLDTLLNFGQLPLITLPTRVTNNTSTLIDHISSNTNVKDIESGLILSSLSDHYPVFVIQSNMEKTKFTFKSKTNYKINDNTTRIFKDRLDNVDWSEVIQDKNPSSAFENVDNIISRCFNESFPTVTVKNSKHKTPIEPWVTPGMLVSRKRKNKLEAKKIKNPSPENISKFIEYKRMYKSILRKAKNKYYLDKFNEYSKNIKETWNVLRKVLKTSSSKSNIPDTFVSNGKIYSGLPEIADGFNDFFVKIGPKLASEIPAASKDFTEYLSNPIEHNFIFANVTVDSILETLSLLKSKTSYGRDNISTKLLKEIMPNIIYPIIYLFNLSLKTGFIPQNYKCAKIIPIYKSGLNNDFTNYRPISLLSSFSKLLEKLVAQQMFKFINKYKILYSHQYGFRPKHDTTQPQFNSEIKFMRD